jgi:hypothetical protein
LPPKDTVKGKLEEFGETNEEQIRFMKERLDYMKEAKKDNLTAEQDTKIEEILKEVEVVKPA